MKLFWSGHWKILKICMGMLISRILRTMKTDTHGCGVGLGDTKLSPFIDSTLFDTETKKTQVST